MRRLRGSNVMAVLAKLAPIIRGWAASTGEWCRPGCSAAWTTTCGNCSTSGPHRAPRTSRSPDRRRYFGEFDKFRNDNWVFGRDSGTFLVKFSWTNIVRHAMVKGAASPDDPALAGYWAERREKVKPPLDKYTLRLLTRQDARCPLCAEHLLTADQPPQSPGQWERWSLQVTRKAIVADYLMHHGGPGSPDGNRTRPRTHLVLSRARSPPARGIGTADLHAPAACLSRVPR